MVTNRPLKKFFYMEDNDDGTCTMVLSLPEADIFESAVLSFDFDDMFHMVQSEVPDEIREFISGKVTVIPDFPEG